ncbi:MAG: tetratricopeptide repeat protein, partial [Gammaproteobacteria bacterium]|nr:tetratricopeptide repeat protein [Gammaproteobacteria bacterium]
WSLFKQNNYQAALIAFFKLLDSKQEYGLTNELEYPSHISRVEKEFLDDILRSISLTVSYMDGVNTLIQYLARHYAQQYEPLLFDRLATMYFTKKRYLDAANTYLAYSRSKPASLLAPDFHEKAIAIYQQAKFSTLVLNAKIDFIKQYGLDSHYWDIHEQSARNRLQPKLTRNIKEMATYYHSQMRQSQQQSDYDQAVYWYKFYIITFPNEQEASEINFMLAEIKAERKLYQEAIIEFEKTAYNYPAHSKSSEAAYAALLLYPQVIKTLPAKEAIQWQRKEIASDLNFADKFSFDSRATIVLANASEKLYDLREYSQAKQTVEKLIARFRPNTQTTLQQAAWIVHGHTNFETANYTDAEKSYTNALKFMTQKSTNRGAIEERLAASIYKQGEQALKEKQTEVASFHFLRIRNVTPTVDIRWTADYDAATILIHAEQWTQAQLLLEGLRQHYSSKEKIQLSISEKLAFIYAKTGHPYQAAKEMEKLASASTDPVYQRDILWQTAELYHNNKHPDDAARLYQNYVKDYPQQFDHTLEAQQFLAEYYTERKNTTESNKWYERIVKQDQNGGKQRTDRSRYLAAQASLILAAPLFREYQNAQLTIPLKKSLKIKKQLMQNTINAYQKVIDYNVIDVTTSATYSIAEIYNDFSRSLMQSQRPRNLKDEALEQYDILLEEQAYPFEEKAISIHQANLKNMANGVWDEWVQKSLDRLKKIQPVRYAKTERVEPYVSRMY